MGTSILLLKSVEVLFFYAISLFMYYIHIYAYIMIGFLRHNRFVFSDFKMFSPRLAQFF